MEETTPDTLSIRLQAVPQADRQEVWEKVRGRLRPYLAAQGAPGARLELAPEMPRQDSISGKFRQVWATLDAGHVEKS